MISALGKKFSSLVLGTLCVLTLWCAPAQAAEGPDRIVLQLHWKHQFEYAGYYAAQMMGYFAEEGLEVSIRELSDKGTSIESVLSGSAQYGISPSALILERMHGKPLVLLANDLKSSPLSLLTSEEFTDLSQLRGLKIMAAPDELRHAEIVYMLRANGIGAEELTWIPHTYQSEDVLNGHAAAMTAYLTNQPYELVKQKIPHTVFTPRDYGIDFYGNNLFTSEDELKNNPQRVRKVLRASKRGWKYAIQHPDTVIDYILKNYPVQKSRNALQFEAKEISKLVSTENCPPGSIDLKKIDNIARMFVVLDLADEEYDFNGFIAAETELCRESSSEWENPPLEPAPVSLSAAEQSYLVSRPPLTACMVEDWPPFEKFDDEGNVSGLTADFTRLLTPHIGQQITPVRTKNISEAFSYAKARKCDLLLLHHENPELEKHMTFTGPVLRSPFVIIGKSGQSFYGGLEALAGKTLALFRGHHSIEAIKKDYPQIKLVIAEDTQDTFKKIHSGEADATLCSLTSFVSSISMMGETGLQVAGETEFILELAVGIRNDEPTLVEIMQKAVAALQPEEINETINRWFSVRVEKRFDYALFWKILGFFLVVVVLLLYRHSLLSRHHNQLHKAHGEALQEKERAEKALQAERDAIKDNLRFVDMISHEYRTPVSIISANLDILEMKNIDTERSIEPNLNKMRRATKKLVSIIETALDKDRVDTNKLVINKQAFVLYDMLEGTLVEIRNDHPERIIDAVNQLPDNCRYNGDLELLSIVLRNLIENALKYSPQDSAVTISAKKSDTCFLLSVEDRGRGVPASEANLIFDKYHRASNTSDISGAGVGLYLCKKIIEQHDGQISIKSSEQHGTTVTLQLPFSSK